MDRLSFLSDVLEDFCTKYDLPFMSADDLLYSNEISEGKQLTQYQRDWLTNYIDTWDTIQELETQSTPTEMQLFIPNFHD